jgi:hypothetical protein
MCNYNELQIVKNYLYTLYEPDLELYFVYPCYKIGMIINQ